MLHTAQENTGRKKSPQNSPFGHHRTTLSGCIFATKACIGNRKKNLLNSNISSTCPHNMANFGPLKAEICLPVLGTQQISTALMSCLCYCSEAAHRRPTKLLHDVWLSHALAHYIYIFGGSCPPDGILQVQNSLYVQFLRSPILATLLHGTPAADVSQTMWRGTRSGITELSQKAPPIFGWAAITLGISPHSSLKINYLVLHVRKL